MVKQPIKDSKMEMEVAVLYAGGRSKPFKDQADYALWAAEFFQMQMVASATPVLISGKPMNGDVRVMKRVARRLKREWNKYDGFVVTIEPELFLYAANVLHITLGEVGKPVVCLTTAVDAVEGRRLVYSDMGLKANIMNGIQGATASFRGVAVVGGSGVYFPDQVLMEFQRTHLAFESSRGEQIGRVDFGVLLNDIARPRSVQRPDLDLSTSESVVYAALRWSDKEFSWPPKKEWRKDGPSGLILDGGEHLKLSVTKDLPEVPTLLLSDNMAYLYRDGQLTELPGSAPAAAAAHFAWLLGQEGEVNLLRELLSGHNPKRS